MAVATRHRAVWPAGVDLRCLHGDRSDWYNRTVIVPAVYREWYSAAAHGPRPPEWLQRQYPVFLYQRRNESASCYCANRGYESAVYFWFIAQHYSRLPAHVAFIQADWIFATKQSAGGSFRFWQPSCAEGSTSPWRDYMPLGGRRSVWPPRCVARQLTWYSRLVGKRNAAVVEACARELLRILEWPGDVRPYDRARPLNITFYTNMNFLASRTRLRRYTHRTYRVLAQRFVEEGICIPPAVGGGHGGGSGGGADRSSSSSTSSSNTSTSLSSSNVVLSEALSANGIADSATFAKVTLGMATELLQQVIFGDATHLLEHGPAPVVPLNGENCTTPHPGTKCSIGS